jgi:hypothetical protein
MATVNVSDSVAPAVVSGSASHVANVALDAASVQLAFAVDELPSTVYYVAARSAPATARAVVTSGAIVSSGVLLASVRRGESIHLVAVDAVGNESPIRTVTPVDAVAPRILTTSGEEVANGVNNTVTIQVRFTVDETPSFVHYLAVATGAPAPSVAQILLGENVRCLRCRTASVRRCACACASPPTSRTCACSGAPMCRLLPRARWTLRRLALKSDLARR